MPTVACATLGCKVNQYESDRILAGFAERGFSIVAAEAPADVYVINTCSVTSVAEAKSRKLIRKLAKQNPGATVVVTGCDAEMARLVGRTFPDATLIVANDAKLDIPRRVADRFAARSSAQAPVTSVQPSHGPRIRRVIKVQDGCDMFCTYCSVPLTRGEVRSRSARDILAEVASAVATGHREIVLTGVLLGSYGRDFCQSQATGEHPGSGNAVEDLPSLIEEIAAVPGVERIRLSSIEPPQVSERLLDAAAQIAAFTPHLHIPLQSGDDGVLAGMNRPYTRSEYRDLCRRACITIEDLAITTDVMVGFPGETDQAFENTLDLVREIGFARMHVFRYSPRPLTVAASRTDQVPESVRAQRANRLGQVARDLQLAFARRYLGRTMDVLAEPLRDSPGWLAGYTPNYIRVVFETEPSAVGQIVPVRLLRIRGAAVLGELS